MTASPKFVKLLTSIKDATEQGRVEWVETLDEDTFRVILDRAVIRIGRDYDEFDNCIRVEASLADKKGDILDSLSTREVVDEETINLLHAIYDMARRRVKKIDKLIDELITEVETGGF